MPQYHPCEILDVPLSLKTLMLWSQAPFQVHLTHCIFCALGKPDNSWDPDILWAFLASCPARQTLFSSGWLIPGDIYLLKPLFMLFLLSPSIYKTYLFLPWAPRRLHLSMELLCYLTLGGNSGRFYFGGSKITAVTAAAKLKDICSLEEKLW